MELKDLSTQDAKLGIKIFTFGKYLNLFSLVACLLLLIGYASSGQPFIYQAIFAFGAVMGCYSYEKCGDRIEILEELLKERGEK